MSPGLARAPRIAVIGGGWAGAAAALEAQRLGARVRWLEASAHWGGRARSVDIDGHTLDNGQHILIGAYSECLRLMRQAGVDPETALLRLPLELRYADGHALRAARLPAPLHLLAALATAQGLPLGERLGWMTASLRWKLARWRAPAGQTVSALCRALGPTVMQRYIEPLCVAALNTPAEQADAQVFLNVLRDSLGAPQRATSDYLLPRQPLGALLTEPAARRLQAAGHEARLRYRVDTIAPEPVAAQGWRVNGEDSDALVLACPPWQAARLLAPLRQNMPAVAEALDALRTLRYAPIATCYAWAAGAALGRLRERPMMALLERPGQPFQFVFDRSAIEASTPSQPAPVATGEAHCLAFVASAAPPAADSAGESAIDWSQALAQAAADLGMPTTPRLLRCIVEKRATFVCDPAVRRPQPALAPGLALAGDYVAGPYPSTLEGAVRSGVQAARLALGSEQATGRKADNRSP